MVNISTRKPVIYGIEGSVTDRIYKPGLGNEALKRRFFSELKELMAAANPEQMFSHILENPRAGDNITIAAEEFNRALIYFGQREGLLPANLDYSGDMETAVEAYADRVAVTVFGPYDRVAGGALANTFDAMIHSRINGKNLLDGEFVTVVGEDEAGRVFADSLEGCLDAPRKGKQMEAHIIPVGSDRIIVAGAPLHNAAQNYLDETLVDPEKVKQADVVGIGGYLFFADIGVPHESLNDKVMARIARKILAAISELPEGERPTVVLTPGAQMVAASPLFQQLLEEAAQVTNVVVHANTGEFRRMLRTNDPENPNLDVAWRKEFAARHGDPFKGLVGHALEDAKQPDAERQTPAQFEIAQAYQAAKADANQVALTEGVRRARQWPHDVTFVVTNGGKGAHVASREGFNLAPYPVKKLPPGVKPQTVGAGDNFAAGYELGLALGLDKAGCIELAQSFATAVIQQEEARLPADATRTYRNAGHTLVAGGALVSLDDTPLNRAMLGSMEPRELRRA